MTRPQPASADGPCAVSPVYLDLSGSTLTLHRYVFDTTCQPGGAVHVSASYDVNSTTAQEDLKGAGDSSLHTAWNCTHDPWIATTQDDLNPVTPNCVPQNVERHSSPSDFWEDAYLRAPFSATYLNDSAHALIAARLQIAAPAPAPTLPDFKIMAVRAVDPKPDPADKNKELLTNGMTASYDVVFANLGAKMPQISVDPSKKPQVQVSIQVTGSLQYPGTIQSPSGWDCSGSGPIVCVGPLGGYGDAIQDTVVTMRLQVLGAKVGIGVGAISAAADHGGLIKESDVNNNTFTLAITVK